MRTVKGGTTDVSVVIRIIDSTDGTPETGVTAATGGLVLEYRRELAASVSLATIVDLAALTTAHTDKGIKHVGNGYYRVDLPDAACAGGAVGVLIHGVATGMVVVGEYISLVAYDPADGVRLGLTALPSAAADAAGGLPISDAGGLDLDARLDAAVSSRMATYTQPTNFLAATFPGGTIANTTNITAGTIATATNLTNLPSIPAGWLTAAGIDADAITAAKIADGAIDAATFAAGAINAAAIAANAFNAAKFDPDVAVEMQAGLATASALSALSTTIGVAGAGLTDLGGMSTTMKAQVESEATDALVAIHLDHLLAVDYDPASKPGVATALLNELIESDAGVSRYTANSLEQAPTGGSAPTVGQIADAVWDEILSGHVIAGSTGEALGAAGGAGDPWITALPGAYGAGSAGFILGTNLNATLSSRSSHSAADVWAAGTRVLTAGTNIQLPSNGLANVTAWTVAITGNITGNLSGSVGSVTGSVGSISGVTFPSNFAALGINVSGHVSRVVLVDTITAYTGNTVQSGDAFARIGVPVGASTSADIAAVKLQAGAIETDTQDLQVQVGVAGLGLSAIPKTGFKLASDGLNLVVPSDPAAIPVLGTANIVTWIGFFGLWSVGEVNSDNNSVNLRNSADTLDLATYGTSDDGTTFSSGEPA